MRYFDRVQFTTATTGTGSLTVGSAVSGYQTPVGAGMVDSNESYYCITDGTAWETGRTVAASTATVFSRELHFSSTGSLLSLTGSAVVFFTLTAFAADQLQTTARDQLMAVGLFLM